VILFYDGLMVLYIKGTSIEKFYFPHCAGISILLYWIQRSAK